jgi:uncharacterized membrane protein YraQ (UPF0718 family)
MLIATLIMGGLALIMLAIGFQKGGGRNIEGLTFAWSTLLYILPLLIFAFIIAGMAQTLVPQGAIAEWLGAKAGLSGIFIGAFVGSLIPGGPFVSLPIAAVMLKSGAGLGTMVAFVTGWGMGGIGRMMMEVGILGWRFTAIRLVSSFIFAPLAGVIAQAVFGGVWAESWSVAWANHPF